MHQNGTKSGKKRGFKMAKVILVVVKYMAFVGLYSKKTPKLTKRVNGSESWHPKAAKCPSKTSSLALMWSLLLMVFSWVASFLFTVHLITSSKYLGKDFLTNFGNSVWNILWFLMCNFFSLYF